MHVGLDVAATQRPRLTGWERFILELTTALNHFEGSDVFTRLEMSRESRGRVNTLLAQLYWYAFGLPSAVRQTGVDVVLCSAFPPPPLDVPVVWTVHDDLILGGHPEYSRRGAHVWGPLARRAAARVDAIVTDTAAVGDELARRGVDPGRIHVVPPGVPRLPSKQCRPRLLDHADRVVSFPADFALTVGTVELRKRPDVAVHASRIANIPLVVCGAVASRADDRAVRNPGVYRTGRVTDVELAWLYRHASVLIAASDYEGFDLPTVEARAEALPVVASDIPVHREVCLDAFFFPPGDAAEAAKAIRRATAPGPSEFRLTEGWHATAAGYLAVLQHVASRA